MSQYTNIAGIADTPRYMLYISDNIIFRRVTFHRRAEPEISSFIGTVPEHAYDPVEDETTAYPTGLSIAANIRLNSFLVLNIGRPAADGTFPRSPRLPYERVVSVA